MHIGERMKKKKMLRSCIASFLTGGMATIVHAHGMVGMSDAPMSSVTRPVINSGQPVNESLSQPSSSERMRPVVPESRQGRSLQESLPSPQQSNPLNHTSSQEEQVRIIRSGYSPRPGSSTSLGQSEVTPNRQREPAPEQVSPIRSEVAESLPSAPSIIKDEMVTERQPALPTAPPVAESAATDVRVETPEISSQQTVNASHRARLPTEGEGRLATERASGYSTLASSQSDTPIQAGTRIQSGTPSQTNPSVSTADIQPQQSGRSTQAQGTFNFDFQRYEPAAGLENDVVSQPAMASAEASNQASTQASTEAFSAPLGSTHNGGMSIHEIVQRAIAWHPSITEALGRLYQQNEQVSVARAGYFPQVSAGISTERRSSTGRSEDAFTVSASQLLYDFGRISSEVDAASFGVDRDQARVWLAMDQLARDAAQAAIEVQRFQALLDISDEQIEGINDLRLLAERRSQLGASTRSDEIQAQSRLESSEATKLQLEAQLKSWENTVRTLIGASGPVSIKRDFPQHLVESCELAAEDFDNVPELLIAEAQQAEARAIIAQTQASFFPTASIDAGFNQFFNNDLIEDDNEVTVRLNLTSNLYQGGATSARRRAADFSLQASQAARDSALLSLSRSLREAKEQTASFDLRLATLDARARSIRETQALYRQQYLSLGTRSLLDLLNAEQEIHQSRFDQENSRYDLYSLQIDCLYSAADIRSAFDLEDSMVQGVSVLQ